MTEDQGTRLRALARETAFNRHAHYCLEKNAQGHVQGMNDSEWGFSACPHPDCAMFAVLATEPPATTALQLADRIADIARGMEDDDVDTHDPHQPENCGVCRKIAGLIEGFASLAAAREPQPSQETPDDVVASLTAAVREADETFQRVGGSSRHWVRDCFLPALTNVRGDVFTDADLRAAGQDWSETSAASEQPESPAVHQTDVSHLVRLVVELRSQLQGLNIDGTDVWNFWLDDDIDSRIDTVLRNYASRASLPAGHSEVQHERQVQDSVKHGAVREVRTDSVEEDSALHDLPKVAGSFERTLSEFERSCLVHLMEEQRSANPNNALIATLCDAVRVKREYVETLQRMSLPAGEPPQET